MLFPVGACADWPGRACAPRDRAACGAVFPKIVNGGRTTNERVQAMARVLCVLYDDPIDGYPPRYARDDIPQIERYPDGQSTPTPQAIDFIPGELFGSVSGELGLRRFLEERGHELVVTSDKDGEDSVFEREPSCSHRRKLDVLDGDPELVRKRSRKLHELQGIDDRPTQSKHRACKRKPRAAHVHARELGLGEVGFQELTVREDRLFDFGSLEVCSGEHTVLEGHVLNLAVAKIGVVELAELEAHVLDPRLGKAKAGQACIAEERAPQVRTAPVAVSGVEPLGDDIDKPDSK
jgi:hypothetical protein